MRCSDEDDWNIDNNEVDNDNDDYDVEIEIYRRVVVRVIVRMKDR